MRQSCLVLWKATLESEFQEQTVSHAWIDIAWHLSWTTNGDYVSENSHVTRWAGWKIRNYATFSGIDTVPLSDLDKNRGLFLSRSAYVSASWTKFLDLRSWFKPLVLVLFNVSLEIHKLLRLWLFCTKRRKDNSECVSMPPELRPDPSELSITV